MSTIPALQKPYTLTMLPRPIDHVNGRYVVSNVYGGSTGSKKRKRSELAVGIDGEGVNLYDVSTARLITSYALPPQSSFTCPPWSLRLRASKNRIVRKTYVSTKGSQPQITLFEDIIEGSGAANSTAKNVNLNKTSRPVFFMGTVTASRKPDASIDSEDLVVVKDDGEIQCFDADNLEEKWTSPATALERSTSESNQRLKIEHTQIINALEAREGLLKAHEELLTLFPQQSPNSGISPQLLFIVTKSGKNNPTTTLHVVALPKIPIGNSDPLQRSVDSLLAVQLPSRSSQMDKLKSSFNLQASSGILQQLCGNWVTTFDLTDTLPKEISEIYSSDANSFVRLSNTSIVVSSATSVSVYNPKYQSLVGSLNVEGKDVAKSAKRKRSEAVGINGDSGRPIEVVSYFQKLDLVVAIQGHVLIAFETEGQHDRHGRARGAGLLIDSLGCSTREDQQGSKMPRTDKMNIGLSTMASCVSSLYVPAKGKAGEGLDELHDCFLKGDTAEFDTLISKKLGVDWPAGNAKIAKASLDQSTSRADSKTSGWLNSDHHSFAGTNQWWVLYLLGQIFSLSREGGGEPQLAITFYPLNTFTWLIRTGSMTTVNVESALRKYHGRSPSEPLPVGALVDAIVEFDPDMDLLLALISSTPLVAAELLHAIRTLMESLELFGEKQNATRGLVENEDATASAEEDVEKEVKRLEKEVEEDLQLAEYQLGPGSGLRGQALTLALSKLYTCPDSTIIAGLQTIFSSQEIVSLVYLLRFELARGAWTSRYLDSDLSDIVDEDADIPDNAIVLISSLLNNCVDAVGAGGWLSGDARLLNKDPFEAEELITSLKLEVSAALEGIEEAVYLKGLTSEMIRYGDLSNLSEPEPQLPPGTKRKIKPIMFAPFDQDFQTLPLGLKAERRISKHRVGAGGEVQQRSMRDIGRLKSQKVGKYSWERIVI